MIYYKLRSNTGQRDLYLGRMKKYYQRGFDWLIPVKLSNDIYIYKSYKQTNIVCVMDVDYNFDRFDIETLFREHTAADEKFQQARKNEEKIIETAIAKDSSEKFGRLASNAFRINTDCLQVRKSFATMLMQQHVRLSQN